MVQRVVAVTAAGVNGDGNPNNNNSSMFTDMFIKVIRIFKDAGSCCRRDTCSSCGVLSCTVLLGYFTDGLPSRNRI